MLDLDGRVSWIVFAVWATIRCAYDGAVRRWMPAASLGGLGTLRAAEIVDRAERGTCPKSGSLLTKLPRPSSQHYRTGLCTAQSLQFNADQFLRRLSLVKLVRRLLAVVQRETDAMMCCSGRLGCWTTALARNDHRRPASKGRSSNQDQLYWIVPHRQSHAPLELLQSTI